MLKALGSRGHVAFFATSRVCPIFHVRSQQYSINVKTVNSALLNEHTLSPPPLSSMTHLYLRLFSSPCSFPQFYLRLYMCRLCGFFATVYIAWSRAHTRSISIRETTIDFSSSPDLCDNP